MNDKVKNEIKSWAIVILIALALKATVIEAYQIPTGSMENTILVGDFILGKKFTYGTRTPSWIGIPWTKIGFNIPYFRLPGFRKPKQGDIVIFKYPLDTSLNYIKRCIAGPGQTLVIKEGHVYVDGEKFINPSVDPKLNKFVDQIVHSLSNNNIKKIAVLNFSDNQRKTIPNFGKYFAEELYYKLSEIEKLEVYERHQLTEILEEKKISSKNLSKNTIKNLAEILNVDVIISGSTTYKGTYVEIDARLTSCESGQVISNPSIKISNYIKFGDHLKPTIFQERGLFPPNLGNRDNYGPLYVPAKGDTLYSDKQSLFVIKNVSELAGHKMKLNNGQMFIDDKEADYYIVEQDHYFMMGDNRHNSSDSRYWGFVPFDLILGNPLITYMSWNKEVPLYNFTQKIRWKRIGNIPN